MTRSPAARRAVLLSLGLHGALAALLTVVLVGGPSVGPRTFGPLDFETPATVALEESIPPLPETEAPTESEVAVAEPELLAQVEHDEPEDPRLADAAAPVSAAAYADGSSPIGIGGGGLRVRARRNAPAAEAASAGGGTGDGDGEGGGSAPVAPTTRARAIGDACEPPEYPSRERRLGVEGTVLLLIRIDAAGRVASSAVEASSGCVAFDDAASAAVARWRFSPALLHGVPVEDSIRLRVRFSLVDAMNAGDGSR